LCLDPTDQRVVIVLDVRRIEWGPTLATALTVGQSPAPAIAAAPPKE